LVKKLNGVQPQFINRTVSVDGDAVLATANYGGCAADYEGTGDTGGTDPVAPTIALPVDFEEAADAYEIAGFDGGVASVEAGPDGAVSLKYVKGAGQNWAGVWIDLDTAVDAANGEVITAAVHSTVARDITLKFDAANVERVASHRVQVGKHCLMTSLVLYQRIRLRLHSSMTYHNKVTALMLGLSILII
jgi:hypothetical protein